MQSNIVGVVLRNNVLAWCEMVNKGMPKETNEELNNTTAIPLNFSISSIGFSKFHELCDSKVIHCEVSDLTFGCDSYW